MPHKLPTRIEVRVGASEARLDGMAVGLRFHMAKKNDYNVLVFLDARGRAELSRAELEEECLADRNASPMDYVSPAAGFAGAVTAEVLDRDAIDGALAAYELYGGESAYPQGYAERLRRAKALPVPPECRVRVRMIYGRGPQRAEESEPRLNDSSKRSKVGTGRGGRA